MGVVMDYIVIFWACTSIGAIIAMIVGWYKGHDVSFDDLMFLIFPFPFIAFFILLYCWVKMERFRNIVLIKGRKN